MKKMKKLRYCFYTLLTLQILSNDMQATVTRNPDYQVSLTVNLDDGGVQTLTGLELPLLDNAYEKSKQADFSNGMIRMLSKQVVYLMRVHPRVHENLPEEIKRIAYLGIDGTYLAAKFFKNAEQAKNYSALLTKWHHDRGGIAQFSVIEVPARTEMYVGNAKTQMDIEEVRDENGKVQTHLREIRIGGGVQLLIPPKNFATKEYQLNLKNVIETNNLKSSTP